MANWQPCDGSFVAQAISENSTTQKVEIGRRIKCIDASVTGSLGIGEFVYLIGVASTAIGTAVIYDRYTGLTTRASANAKGPIAFAMAATVASQYGWYQIFGNCAAKVVVGDEVYTATSVSAINTPSTGLALISCSYPFVSDASN